MMNEFRMLSGIESPSISLLSSSASSSLRRYKYSCGNHSKRSFDTTEELLRIIFCSLVRCGDCACSENWFCAVKWRVGIPPPIWKLSIAYLNHCFAFVRTKFIMQTNKIEIQLCKMLNETFWTSILNGIRKQNVVNILDSLEGIFTIWIKIGN